MLSIFTYLPFLTCFFWLLMFLLRWRHNNEAQHVLTAFCAVCSMLYLCHACYFLGEETVLSSSLWRMCSLASYPMYYLYIVRLTVSEKRIPWACYLLLVPAVCIPLGLLILPGIDFELIQKVMFIILVLYTCASGLRRLWHFEQSVNEFYADTDNKSSRPIRLMLIALTVTSILSAIASAIGREFFSEHMLIIIPSVLFTIMLFALLYIGDAYHFSAIQMVKDVPDIPEESSADIEQADFVRRLQQLMQEEHIFLEHNLKLSDVALRSGTCRTYISNYLNQQLNTTFTDYINRQRIEYAEQLLKDDPTLKNDYLAEVSGFASEQSFLRNYRKFTGHNPRN